MSHLGDCQGSFPPRESPRQQRRCGTTSPARFVPNRLTEQNLCHDVTVRYPSKYKDRSHIAEMKAYLVIQDEQDHLSTEYDSLGLRKHETLITGIYDIRGSPDQRKRSFEFNPGDCDDVTVRLKLKDMDRVHGHQKYTAHIKVDGKWTKTSASYQSGTVAFNASKIDTFCVSCTPPSEEFEVTPSGGCYQSKHNPAVEIQFPENSVKKTEKIDIQILPVDLLRVNDQHEPNDDVRTILALSVCVEVLHSKDFTLLAPVKLRLPLHVASGTWTDEYDLVDLHWNGDGEINIEPIGRRHCDIKTTSTGYNVTFDVCEFTGWYTVLTHGKGNSKRLYAVQCECFDHRTSCLSSEKHRKCSRPNALPPLFSINKGCPLEEWNKIASRRSTTRSSTQKVTPKYIRTAAKVAVGIKVTCKILVFTSASKTRTRTMRFECVQLRRIKKVVEACEELGLVELRQCRSPDIMISVGERIRVDISGCAKVHREVSKEHTCIPFIGSMSDNFISIPIDIVESLGRSAYVILNFTLISTTKIQVHGTHFDPLTAAWRPRRKRSRSPYRQTEKNGNYFLGNTNSNDQRKHQNYHEGQGSHGNNEIAYRSQSTQECPQIAVREPTLLQTMSIGMSNIAGYPPSTYQVATPSNSSRATSPGTQVMSASGISRQSSLEVLMNALDDSIAIERATPKFGNAAFGEKSLLKIAKKIPPNKTMELAIQLDLEHSEVDHILFKYRDNIVLATFKILLGWLGTENGTAEESLKTLCGALDEIGHNDLKVELHLAFKENRLM